MGRSCGCGWELWVEKYTPPPHKIITLQRNTLYRFSTSEVKFRLILMLDTTCCFLMVYLSWGVLGTRGVEYWYTKYTKPRACWYSVTVTSCYKLAIISLIFPLVEWFLNQKNGKHGNCQINLQSLKCPVKQCYAWFHSSSHTIVFCCNKLSWLSVNNNELFILIEKGIIA